MTSTVEKQITASASQPNTQIVASGKPLKRSLKSRFFEGCTRLTLASGTAWTIGCRLKNYGEYIADFANRPCISIEKATFISLFNQKSPLSETCAHVVDTCFTACTHSMNLGTSSNLIGAHTWLSLAEDFPQRLKNYYLAVLPKGSPCSLPETCLEVCESAQTPWSTIEKIEFATEAAWAPHLLPLIQITAIASQADTIAGAAGLEGSILKEGARWALGTAITAMAAPTILEAALIYSAYRTGYTALRYAFSEINTYKKQNLNHVKTV